MEAQVKLRKNNSLSAHFSECESRFAACGCVCPIAGSAKRVAAMSTFFDTSLSKCFHTQCSHMRATQAIVTHTHTRTLAYLCVCARAKLDGSI